MKKKIFQLIIGLFIVSFFIISCGQPKKCPAYSYHQETSKYTE